jgi:hypothetical protein
MSKRGTKNYFKVGISDAKPTGLTTLAALIAKLKMAGAAYISTGEAFIDSATAVSVGLEKAAKLGYAPDGEEDNLGNKESKVTFSCNLVGVDLDATYDSLRNLATGRKYAFLIDEEKKLVKWAGPLKMTFTDASEGNALEKITISGEETADIDDIYDRVTLT